MDDTIVILTGPAAGQTESGEAANPETNAPEAETPGSGNPKIELPEVETPEDGAPGKEVPKITLPEIKLPGDGETVPDEGEALPETGISAEAHTGQTVDEGPDDPAPPDPLADFALLWICLGVAAGLILGVLSTLLIGKLRRRSKPILLDEDGSTEYTVTEHLPSAVPTQLVVSKLHEQGARSSQQDSFAVTPPELIPTKGTLAVVCDGMGGLQDGDKVSQAAVSAMINGFLELQGSPDRLLLGLLGRANRAVNDLLGPAGQRRSGTTMVAGILKDDLFSYLSVGDSRISLFRDGQLIQLNREHVYYNELSADAVNGHLSFTEAWTDPQQAALTSFLGMGELKYVDIPAQSLQVLAGDKLILMSDGVYNALTEEELCTALSLPAGQDTDALRTVISEKNFAQQDNYTAVVLTIEPAVT